MNDKEIKSVEKLLKSYAELLGNCVDSIGIPKSPTAKQLRKAIEAKNKFEAQFKTFAYNDILD
jgi:hypothetical protein